MSRPTRRELFIRTGASFKITMSARKNMREVDASHTCRALSFLPVTENHGFNSSRTPRIRRRRNTETHTRHGALIKHYSRSRCRNKRLRGGEGAETLQALFTVLHAFLARTRPKLGSARKTGAVCTTLTDSSYVQKKAHQRGSFSSTLLGALVFALVLKSRVLRSHAGLGALSHTRQRQETSIYIASGSV